MKSYALTQEGIHCKCKYPVIWSISPSAIHEQTSDRYRRKHEEHACSSDGNPNARQKSTTYVVQLKARILSLACFRSLRRLSPVTTPGGTSQAVTMVVVCWIWCVSNWRKNYGKIFFARQQQKAKARRGGHTCWEIGSTLITPSGLPSVARPSRWRISRSAAARAS